MRRTVSFVFLVTLSGCQHGQLISRFPIGLFGVTKPEEMPIVRDAGFTDVHINTRYPETLVRMAKGARQEGLRLLIPPQDVMRSTRSPSAFPITAWFLADEPDVHRTPPGDLAAVDREVKAWDPERPTAFVVGRGSAATDYAHIADVIMVDWYPVPHLPLTSAGDQVRMAVQAASGKPVWAVLQAMDWRWYPQRDPKKPRIGRFPTTSELRFMSYHSLLEGARGLWYFCFTSPAGRTLVEDPELWHSLTPVIRELAAFRSVLERGQPIALPVELTTAKLQAKAWRLRYRDYLVILNKSATETQLPAGLLDGHWRLLFHGRRSVGEALTIRGDKPLLSPYQVLVLERRRPLLNI